MSTALMKTNADTQNSIFINEYMSMPKEHGPAHLSPQTPGLADAHRSEEFDQLLMPGAHQVGDPTDRVAGLSLVHRDGAVLVADGNADH